MPGNTKIFTMMIVSGVAAVVLWGVFGFLWFLIGDARTALGALRIEQSDVYTRDVHDTALRSLTRDTQDRRAQLSAITDTRDVVGIIRVLEDVSEAAGLNVSVSAVSTKDSDDVYETLIVSLGTRGAFDDVVHTLALLEAPEAAAAIDEFELSHGEGARWNLQVRERVFVDNDSSEE